MKTSDKATTKIQDSIIISTNPATLEAVGEVETTPLGDVEEMVQHAREEFPTWRDLGLKDGLTSSETLKSSCWTKAKILPD